MEFESDMLNESQNTASRRARFDDLFPVADHRLQMRFRRARIADVFARSERTIEVLAERCEWLDRDAHLYAAFLTEAEPALRETCRMLAEADALCLEQARADSANPLEVLIELGRRIEPDLLLLTPDGESGEFRLVAGCVCFPSSWSLSEKMGKPLDVIHGVVPGLNQRLSGPISQFLRRMPAGTAWCRENWGLSGSPELNQHPARGLPRMEPSVAIEQVWLRVERQSLVSLPESGGVLFAIRVEVSPLQAVLNEASARAGLKRALETMPSDLADYKGLGAARARIIGFLS